MLSTSINAGRAQSYDSTASRGSILGSVSELSVSSDEETPRARAPGWFDRCKSCFDKAMSFIFDLRKAEACPGPRCKTPGDVIEGCKPPTLQGRKRCCGIATLGFIVSTFFGGAAIGVGYGGATAKPIPLDLQNITDPANSQLPAVVDARGQLEEQKDAKALCQFIENYCAELCAITTGETTSGNVCGIEIIENNFPACTYFDGGESVISLPSLAPPLNQYQLDRLVYPCAMGADYKAQETGNHDVFIAAAIVGIIAFMAAAVSCPVAIVACKGVTEKEAESILPTKKGKGRRRSGGSRRGSRGRRGGRGSRAVGRGRGSRAVGGGRGSRARDNVPPESKNSESSGES